MDLVCVTASKASQSVPCSLFEPSYGELPGCCRSTGRTTLLFDESHGKKKEEKSSSRRCTRRFDLNGTTWATQSPTVSCQLVTPAQRVGLTRMYSKRDFIGGTARVAIDLKIGEAWPDNEDCYRLNRPGALNDLVPSGGNVYDLLGANFGFLCGTFELELSSSTCTASCKPS